MLCFQDSGCFPLQGETEAEEEVNHCESDDHCDDHGDHCDDHGDHNCDHNDDDNGDHHDDDHDDPLMQRFS